MAKIQLPKLKKTVFEIDFDINKIRNELCEWLQQINFPPYEKASNWNEVIKEFPDEENKPKQKNGVKLRLRLKLYTKENEYILSILECLELDSLDHNIIMVHVNWKDTELKSCEAVNHEYQLEFDSLLKAKHTIWAQTFKLKELKDALNQCVIAILSNELKGSPPKNIFYQTKIENSKTQIRLDLPDTED